MEPILLSQHLADGSVLSATFEPDKGMNLTSLRKGDKEFIQGDQGFLIGPHYGRRLPHMYPGKNEEPVFNGISRYAPWKAEVKDNIITALLDGKDLWNEQPLSSIEGQGFKQRLKAELNKEGLRLELSIVSDTDSLIGIDYSWPIPAQSATLVSAVGPHFLLGRERQDTDKYFPRNQNNEIQLSLDAIQGDYTFYPLPSPIKGIIRLQSPENALEITYSCLCQENCWRLIKDPESSTVRIQPLSAQNPFSPNLSVSSLIIQLSPL